MAAINMFQLIDTSKVASAWLISLAKISRGPWEEKANIHKAHMGNSLGDGGPPMTNIIERR